MKKSKPSLDERWVLLGDATDKSISDVIKRGATHAEAFLTDTLVTEVFIRNSEIFAENVTSDAGVGFRVAVDGEKVGFACTNLVDQKAIAQSAHKALDIAKVSAVVPHFSLPSPTEIPRVSGLYDKRVEAIDVQDVVNIARRVIETAEGHDSRVIAKTGVVSYQIGKRRVINSLGVDTEEKLTRCFIYLGGVGEEANEVTPSCDDYELKRSADINPEVIGKNVAETVIAQLKPRKIDSFEGTAVFEPAAVAYQLFDAIVGALRGDAVANRRSAWANRIGEVVVSDNLEISDAATLKDGFGSRCFDDEGHPSQRTEITRKGKLQCFLQNATSANTLKMENTGNASRDIAAGGLDMTRSIIGGGYRSKPGIYPSNLTIRPGNKTKSELISEVEKGVLVEAMSGFVQAGSGLISAQLSRAHLIQNGEVQYPIRGGMVSGIAFDWLMNVSGIGRETKQSQNAVVPSLRIERVKVLGG